MYRLRWTLVCGHRELSTSWRGAPMSKQTLRFLTTIALLGTACHGPASTDDEANAQGLGAGHNKPDGGGNPGNGPAANPGANPGGKPGNAGGNAGNGGGGKCGVSHAVYTTFNPAVGGCGQGNHPNGVNCNIYDEKDHVYISGGPDRASLPAGTYFFAVLVPGHQNGDFVDGHDGNLSDTTKGATSGDLGSGDAVANRTFSIDASGAITYKGSHVTGM